MSDYYCPECRGARTWGFTFDHERNGCSIGDRDDATRYADAERLAAAWGGISQPATAAEIALAEQVAGHTVTVEAQFRDPLDPLEVVKGPQTIVTRVSAGFARRVIAGVSVPDEAPL